MNLLDVDPNKLMGCLLVVRKGINGLNKGSIPAQYVGYATGGIYIPFKHKGEIVRNDNSKDIKVLGMYNDINGSNQYQWFCTLGALEFVDDTTCITRRCASELLDMIRGHNIVRGTTNIEITIKKLEQRLKEKVDD